MCTTVFSAVRTVTSRSEGALAQHVEFHDLIALIRAGPRLRLGTRRELAAREAAVGHKHAYFDRLARVVVDPDRRGG